MTNLSIIVPVYNAEKYLHRCIDSILAQTFTDFELLLIDDGSTDNSGFICDEYAQKDRRIRVFHKKNGGVSSARNLGLDNVSGEWITFVDSDDILVDSNALTIFSSKNIDADLIVYSFLWNDDLIECPCINNIKEIFFSYHSIAVWGKIYKKSIIQQNHLSFNERINMGEDSLWLTEYMKHTSIYLCNDNVLYRYICMNNNSQSLHNKSESWEKVYYRVKLQIGAYNELERTFGINCKNSVVVLLYNSLNCLLRFYSLKSFREILTFTKLILDSATYYDLWIDSNCVLKGHKMKLFDFFAKNKFYILLALYIKLYGKY